MENVLLILSILVQLAAAILAFRSLPPCKVHFPWALIPLALTLRVAHLGAHWWFGRHELSLLEEAAGLAVSVVVLAGVWFLAPALRSLWGEWNERGELVQELREKTAELDTIIRTMADGVILYGPEGEIRQMNPAAQEIFGYGPDTYGKAPAQRFSPGKFRRGDGSVFPLDKMPVMRTLRGETVRSEIVEYVGDEKRLYLAISTAPILSPEGRILGAVGTCSDITSLRLLQEENESFLHTVTHDLRTPLTVILGHAELLQGEIERTDLGELAKINIEAILTAGQHIDRMMDDLVDFAHLRGGEIELQCRALDLSSFVADFLSRSEVVLDVSRISTEIPADLPKVCADPRYLERSLNNLVANALKYSEAPAPVHIRVSLEGDDIVVRVCDSGQGIPAADLPCVFNRFFRARNAARKAGLGLGLFITRSFIEAHGGRIWVQSVQGEGSTFSFTLPPADRRHSCALGQG